MHLPICLGAMENHKQIEELCCFNTQYGSFCSSYLLGGEYLCKFISIHDVNLHNFCW